MTRCAPLQWGHVPSCTTCTDRFVKGSNVRMLGHHGLAMDSKGCVRSVLIHMMPGLLPCATQVDAHCCLSDAMPS
jgi:hypothetical protein